MHNNKIRIKNFGPIKEGYTDSEDGFFEIQRLSVFIGEQGSGKSTIIKLIATFLWLEKACVRGDYQIDSFTADHFIDLCKNQKLQGYFTQTTELTFLGTEYSFTYIQAQNSFHVKKRNAETYVRPKIMYIPSERNLLAVLEDAEKIQRLPIMLQNIIGELDSAKRTYLPEYFELHLPYHTVFFSKPQMRIFIKEKKTNAIVSLSEASSGLQSLVPLSIVTNYLSDSVNEDVLSKLTQLSKYEKDALFPVIKDKLNIKDGSAMESLLKTFFMSGISKMLPQNVSGKLKDILKPYINSCFINIVEEPEQNLFPTSQVTILNDLLINLNKNEDNVLIIATHSPYILSAINNYIYAKKLQTMGKRTKSISDNCLLDYTDVVAYSLEDGYVKNIMDDESKIIDTTIIDNCASQINTIYDELYVLEYADES